MCSVPDYRLLQRHKVNNVWQEPGVELALPQQLGDWLVGQGVVERVLSDVVPLPPFGDGNDSVIPRANASAPIPHLQKINVAPRFKCCGWK